MVRRLVERRKTGHPTELLPTDAAGSKVVTSSTGVRDAARHSRTTAGSVVPPPKHVIPTRSNDSRSRKKSSSSHNPQGHSMKRLAERVQPIGAATPFVEVKGPPVKLLHKQDDVHQPPVHGAPKPGAILHAQEHVHHTPVHDPPKPGAILHAQDHAHHAPVHGPPKPGATKKPTLRSPQRERPTLAGHPLQQVERAASSQSAPLRGYIAGPSVVTTIKTKSNTAVFTNAPLNQPQGKRMKPAVPPNGVTKESITPWNVITPDLESPTQNEDTPVEKIVAITPVSPPQQPKEEPETHSLARKFSLGRVKTSSRLKRLPGINAPSGDTAYTRTSDSATGQEMDSKRPLRGFSFGKRRSSGTESTGSGRISVPSQQRRNSGSTGRQSADGTSTHAFEPVMQQALEPLGPVEEEQILDTERTGSAMKSPENKELHEIEFPSAMATSEHSMLDHNSEGVPNAANKEIRGQGSIKAETKAARLLSKLTHLASPMFKQRETIETVDAETVESATKDLAAEAVVNEVVTILDEARTQQQDLNATVDEKSLFSDYVRSPSDPPRQTRDEPQVTESVADTEQAANLTAKTNIEEDAVELGMIALTSASESDGLAWNDPTPLLGIESPTPSISSFAGATDDQDTSRARSEVVTVINLRSFTTRWSDIKEIEALFEQRNMESVRKDPVDSILESVEVQYEDDANEISVMPSFDGREAQAEKNRFEGVLSTSHVKQKGTGNKIESATRKKETAVNTATTTTEPSPSPSSIPTSPVSFSRKPTKQAISATRKSKIDDREKNALRNADPHVEKSAVNANANARGTSSAIKGSEVKAAHSSNPTSTAQVSLETEHKLLDSKSSLASPKNPEIHKIFSWFSALSPTSADDGMPTEIDDNSTRSAVVSTHSAIAAVEAPAPILLNFSKERSVNGSLVVADTKEWVEVSKAVSSDVHISPMRRRLLSPFRRRTLKKPSIPTIFSSSTVNDQYSLGSVKDGDLNIVEDPMGAGTAALGRSRVANIARKRHVDEGEMDSLLILNPSFSFSKRSIEKKGSLISMGLDWVYDEAIARGILSSSSSDSSAISRTDETITVNTIQHSPPSDISENSTSTSSSSAIEVLSASSSNMAPSLSGFSSESASVHKIRKIAQRLMMDPIELVDRILAGQNVEGMLRSLLEKKKSGSLN